MSLLDYNSLVTLSVTLNLAYIFAGSLVELQTGRDWKGGSNYPPRGAFYRILVIYLENACLKMGRRRSAGLSLAGNLASRIRHGSNSCNLSEWQKNEIMQVNRILRTCVREVNRLYWKCSADARRFVEIRFFPHISMLFAMAGMMILFAAPMENGRQICVAGLLIVYDIMLTAMLIYFMVRECIPDRKASGRVITAGEISNNTYILVIAAAGIMILTMPAARIYPDITRHIVILSLIPPSVIYEITVAVLYSDFILYFIMVFVRLYICLALFQFKIARLLRHYRIRKCISFLDSLQTSCKPDDISAITFEIR